MGLVELLRELFATCRGFLLLIRKREEKLACIFFNSRRISPTIALRVIHEFENSRVRYTTIDLAMPSDAQSDSTFISFLLFVVCRKAYARFLPRIVSGMLKGDKRHVMEVINIALGSCQRYLESAMFLTSNSEMTDRLKICLAKRGIRTTEVMHAVGSRAAMAMYMGINDDVGHKIRVVPAFPNTLNPIPFELFNCSERYLNLALAIASSEGVGEPPCLSDKEYSLGPVVTVSSQAGFDIHSESLLIRLEAKILRDMVLAFEYRGFKPKILVSRHPNGYVTVKEAYNIFCEYDLVDRIFMVKHVRDGLLICDHFVSFDSSTAWDAALGGISATIFQDGSEDSLYYRRSLAELNHPDSLDCKDQYKRIIDLIVQQSVDSWNDRATQGATAQDKVKDRRYTFGMRSRGLSRRSVGSGGHKS